MPPQLKTRGRALAPTLVLVAALWAGLLGPSTANAVSGASSGTHATHLEERLARRAQRESEREARRSEREQLRAAHRRARQERTGHGNSEKAPETETTAGGSSQSGPCQVTITAASARVLAGESIEISGTATCPGQLAASLPRVQIYERVAGSGLRIATPAQSLPALGGASFTTTSGPLTANTDFQARLGGAHATVAVKVAPAVTLTSGPASVAAPTTTGSTSRTRRTRTLFSGTVVPAVPGALVALQVSFGATGGHWRTIAWTHTDADGAYSVSRSLHTPGMTSVRTIVHTHSHLGVGVSEALSLEGAQPQRSALTIGTSADPVTAGQSLQISGVAAGASHAPVKLLARPTGGSWAVIAESSTDEAGAYGFELTPQETTLYRVLDATASSTPLVEHVGFAITPDPAQATAIAGETVTFAGTVEPAAGGTPVVLEELGPGGSGFHPIAAAAVGPEQEYSLVHVFSSASLNTLRVRVPANHGHSSTAGAPFVLTVAH
jgi:hypothetical protein